MSPSRPNRSVAAWATALMLLLTATAQAHFPFIVTETTGDKTTVAEVYFGEDASPDDPKLLKYVAGIELHALAADREPVALTTKLTDESLTATFPGGVPADAVVVGTHDLGVMTRRGETFRLQYYAKGGPAASNPIWGKVKSGEQLALDVIPTLDGKTLKLAVMFHGKPVADAEVTASHIDETTAKTNENGVAEISVADAGVYSIRVKHVEKAEGELDGKAYSEVRHYATLTVPVTANGPAAAAKFDPVPEPITSFGGAVLGNSLYTYGGHTGEPHSYALEEQGNRLRRLDLTTGRWADVIGGPHLQGLALVAHGGKLYRIGGFTAENTVGEDERLRSGDSVAVFDPQSKNWTKLPALPEARSSFDAAVLGDAIYVIGGWAMAPESDPIWHKTAWKLDLGADKPTWKALPEPPFQRRALAVAAHDGKIYAIGGMQPEGGPTRRTDIYDPETNRWTRGPDLIGERGLTGFGSSSFATGGQLYASTIDGTLQRLSEKGDAWEVIANTPTARFFHRLLPLNDSELVVVGGANMGIGKFEDVEVLDVTVTDVTAEPTEAAKD